MQHHTMAYVNAQILVGHACQHTPMLAYRSYGTECVFGEIIKNAAHASVPLINLALQGGARRSIFC